jgi:hypothetical protein
VKPTKKWLAAQAVAVGAILTSGLESGFDKTELVLLVGAVVQAFVTYMLPNDKTPGGVPE